MMGYGVSEKENKEMRKAVTGVLKTMRDVMEINPGMPAAQIYVLMLVTLNEGKSLQELADMSGTRKATMSRYLLDLSDKLRTGDSGYKLINRDIDPEELRRNMYTLAPRGRHFINNVVSYFA